MSITEAIALLKAYNGPLRLTLFGGASEAMIGEVESTYGITLPDDFKIFYGFSDGFETDEDLFNMMALTEIIGNKSRHKNDPLYIAEYMIYIDMWTLKINPDDCNDYKIIVEANGNKLVLTNSLGQFISRFLTGGVFDAGGLYDWQEEVELQPIYPTRVKTAEVLLTVFYYGLKHDFISRKEVIDWVDRLVMYEDEPEPFFIDLSLCHDKKELISLLNSLQVFENSTVERAMLGLLYHRLLAGNIAITKAISVMDKLSFKNVLTEEERGYIYRYTDKIWMDDLTIATDELTKNVLNFLAYYKGFEIVNYRHWFGFSQQIEYKLSTDEEKQSQGYHAPANKPVIKLWMLYALAYSLALISFVVLITTFSLVQNQIPLNKFRYDLYQLSEVYFPLFVCYYILKSGLWLVKNVIAGFKKVVR